MSIKHSQNIIERIYPKSHSKNIWPETEESRRLKVVLEKLIPVFKQVGCSRHFTVELLHTEQFICHNIGSIIQISTKFMELLPDDHMLACTLGHEFGHQKIDSKYEKFNLKQYALLYITGLALQGKTSGKLTPLLMLFNAWNIEKRDRAYEKEFEADRLGMSYAYMGGYDPCGAINYFAFFKKLGLIENINNHPTLVDRIVAAEKFIKEKCTFQKANLNLS